MTTDADPSIAAAPAEGRPPAVLQVLPALVSGGVERGTVEISAALVAAGWRSCVASAGGKMVHEIERHGGQHVTLPLASKNPLVMRRNVGRLAAAISALGIDIVHARSRAPAWSARAAARRTGRHFVTTFHNAYSHGNGLRRWYNSVMAEGERVIAISQFVAAHLAEVYNVPAARIRTIQRGVDLARFDPARIGAERIIRLARQWRLEDGRAVIMLPGRLTRWKGQLDLVAAVALLGRADLHCLFVGSDEGRGGFRRELEAEIVRRGLAGVCQCVEDCNDMPAALMLADVVVSASNRPEGFGRVIAEAQAMGRPVIATDHGGARETVLPGETGWLVPPADPPALAAALAAALALTPAERLAIAERGMAHIHAHFSTARMCAETLAVYHEVLFPAPRPRAETPVPGLLAPEQETPRA
ncbi:MAG TPA: glycosyltransferase family 4 protein [Stellaceae bacterium]|nr:glycosyltransferase family 4 protein [Stellaceae bacterium]